MPPFCAQLHLPHAHAHSYHAAYATATWFATGIPFASTYPSRCAALVTRISLRGAQKTRMFSFRPLHHLPALGLLPPLCLYICFWLTRCHLLLYGTTVLLTCRACQRTHGGGPVVRRWYATSPTTSTATQPMYCAPTHALCSHSGRTRPGACRTYGSGASHHLLVPSLPVLTCAHICLPSCTYAACRKTLARACLAQHGGRASSIGAPPGPRVSRRAAGHKLDGGAFKTRCGGGLFLSHSRGPPGTPSVVYLMPYYMAVRQLWTFTWEDSTVTVYTCISYFLLYHVAWFIATTSLLICCLHCILHTLPLASSCIVYLPHSSPLLWHAPLLHKNRCWHLFASANTNVALFSGTHTSLYLILYEHYLPLHQWLKDRREGFWL